MIHYMMSADRLQFAIEQNLMNHEEHGPAVIVDISSHLVKMVYHSTNSNPLLFFNDIDTP